MSGPKPRRRRSHSASAEPVSTTSAPSTPTLGDGTGVPYPRELPLYTVRQLAQHLQIGRSTIRRMVKLGQLPYIRVGSQIRFDIMAVRSRFDKAT